MDKLISLLGIVIVLGVLYLLSSDRKNINFKTVGYALIGQVLIALFFVKVSFGRDLLLQLSKAVQKVMDYAYEGTSFVWGTLANAEASTGMIFAIQVLCVIIFFSALVSALNYLGVLPFIIRVVGGAIGKVLGTSKSESFVAVSNIFLGQTEAPVVVGKYLPKMTKSEIMVVLVSGMGSVSGAILVGYAAMGVPMNALLLACSLVPLGSLLVSKILLPETEKGTDNVQIDRKGGSANIIEAISRGTMDGLQLALAVGASLIAIISIVALINGALGLVNLSLEQILGWIFFPIGWLMGLPVDEALKAGQFLGVKLTLNEFVAFSQYADYVNAATQLSERAKMMIAISLCGFANFSSIAICTSGLAVFAPEKRPLIAQLAWKGMIGGAFVSVLSAMFVGLFS